MCIYDKYLVSNVFLNYIINLCVCNSPAYFIPTVCIYYCVIPSPAISYYSDSIKISKV